MEIKNGSHVPASTVFRSVVSAAKKSREGVGPTDPSTVAKIIAPQKNPLEVRPLTHRGGAAAPTSQSSIEDRLKNWFQYHFGLLFGVLNPEEADVAKFVEINVKELEQALESVDKEIGKAPIKNILQSAKQTLDRIKAKQDSIAALENKYSQFSGMTGKIEKLSHQIIHFEEQHKLGGKIKEHQNSIKNYEKALEREGDAGDTWNEFKEVRRTAVEVKNQLLKAVQNDPTLRKRSSIQSLAKSLQGPGFELKGVVKLVHKAYPQYKKLLLGTFRVAGLITGDRLVGLRERSKTMKPLTQTYHTQASDIASMRDKLYGTGGGILKTQQRWFFAIPTVRTRLETKLKAAEGKLGETMSQIKANRIQNREEVAFLADLAKSTPEVRTIYEVVKGADRAIDHFEMERSRVDYPKSSPDLSELIGTAEKEVYPDLSELIGPIEPKKAEGGVSETRGEEVLEAVKEGISETVGEEAIVSDVLESFGSIEPEPEPTVSTVTADEELLVEEDIPLPQESAPPVPDDIDAALKDLKDGLFLLEAEIKETEPPELQPAPSSSETPAASFTIPPAPPLPEPSPKLLSGRNISPVSSNQPTILLAAIRTSSIGQLKKMVPEAKEKPSATPFNIKMLQRRAVMGDESDVESSEGEW